MSEQKIEQGFIDKLVELKYTYRADITDRASLERNFREKFEALNRVNLTDGEFARLLDEIVTPDVFAAARTLRERNAFAHALNLLSHGKYDIYQPSEMVDDNKQLFGEILDAFLRRYEFTLPEVFAQPAAKQRGAAQA